MGTGWNLVVIRVLSQLIPRKTLQRCICFLDVSAWDSQSRSYLNEMNVLLGIKIHHWKLLMAKEKLGGFFSIFSAGGSSCSSRAAQ